jgi:hypothetical protein
MNAEAQYNGPLDGWPDDGFLDRLREIAAQRIWKESPCDITLVSDGLPVGVL